MSIAGGGDGGCVLEAWQDVIAKEAGIPLCEISIVWGNGET